VGLYGNLMIDKCAKMRLIIRFYLWRIIKKIIRPAAESFMARGLRCSASPPVGDDGYLALRHEAPELNLRICKYFNKGENKWQ